MFLCCVFLGSCSYVCCNGKLLGSSGGARPCSLSWYSLLFMSLISLLLLLVLNDQSHVHVLCRTHAFYG